MPEVVAAADRWLGNAVEYLTNSHHRRRLERLGQSDQRHPPEDGSLWAAASPPVRDGNALEVLIDGADYFASLEQALRAAQRSIVIAGWRITPEFAISRGEPPVLLRELLGELAERVDVRVLLWAGAPAPSPAFGRRAVSASAKQLAKGTKIKVVLDRHERPMHCHHDKFVVIDDEVAFVGGFDLTTVKGDRYDTPDHPARGRLGWHDLGSKLRGPAVADVAAHFAERWQAVTGESLEFRPRPSGQVTLDALTADGPPTVGTPDTSRTPGGSGKPGGSSTPDTPGSPHRSGSPHHSGDDAADALPFPPGVVDVQVVRTVPERVYDFAPRGDFRIIESYLRGLRSAEHLIYIENQFLWAPEVVNLIAKKLERPPSPDFRVVVLLPSKANNGEDDTRGQLGLLHDSGTRGSGPNRFLATTLRARTGNTIDHVYVHAKLAIVDDHWLTLGSANLNAHSFFNDTELNLVACNPELARDTRLKLWAAHLERTVDEVSGPPAQVVDELWRPIAAEQLARQRAGQPATHHLIELPPSSRRAARLLGPLQALLVDG